jgi:N-hydroxyarylamine O-acetyltransferase
MQAANFNLPDYFARIGYAGEARADLAGISELMRRQLFSVPFENLDVQAGKIVSLAPEDIVAKIVGQRRGGYCYEVNGLFAMALEKLGVPYRFVAARPMFYPVRRPRTHMALVAEIDGEQWLIDLGFGSYGIRAPLRLTGDGEVRQDHDTYLLSRPNDREYLLQARVDGAWANQYGFDLSYQEWIDFVPANYLNSTHPDAIFVQKLLVVLHNPEGRAILLGDRLKTVTRGATVTREIPAEDVPTVLREVFGLTVAG